jgi:Integrin alpha
MQIYNHGPSTMETGQVRIIWPSYTRNHMHLLYLIEEPHVEGNAKCSKVPTNLANVAVRMPFAGQEELAQSTPFSVSCRLN